MSFLLEKFNNIFNIKKKLNTKALDAAIKLERESMNLNDRSQNYLKNAKQIDMEWRRKWIK